MDKCGWFRGCDWSREVYISYGSGTIFAHCCLKCHRLELSRGTHVDLSELPAERLNAAREEALAHYEDDDA